MILRQRGRPPAGGGNFTSESFEGFPAHIQEIAPFAILFSSVTTG
jgi:hypothetical protein